MTEIQNIRELYFEEGKNISEIQNLAGRDKKTDKYLFWEAGKSYPTINQADAWVISYAVPKSPCDTIKLGLMTGTT